MVIYFLGGCFYLILFCEALRAASLRETCYTNTVNINVA